jgi:hypothetical protein
MKKNQVELFDEIKRHNVRYPKARFPHGVSPCHWFQQKLHKPFTRLISNLPDNSIYLELGSFLGAGSTTLAMKANPTVRAYCVDHFQMKLETARKYAPQNHVMRQPGKRTSRPVAYMRGEGGQLEHFLNNTFEWQDRIVPMQRLIDVHFLRQLVELGVEPTMILIDDNHNHLPVLERLRFISKYWPDARVLLDDFIPMWDGVRTGVRAAFAEGLYSEEKSRLLVGRLMLLERSIRYDTSETTT